MILRLSSVSVVRLILWTSAANAGWRKTGYLKDGLVAISHTAFWHSVDGRRLGGLEDGLAINIGDIAFWQCTHETSRQHQYVATHHTHVWLTLQTLS